MIPAKKNTMKNEYDLTIDVQHSVVHAVGITPVGLKFLQEVAANAWDPSEVIVHIPPGVKLGVRTAARKKFVLVPPPSLH